MIPEKYRRDLDSPNTILEQYVAADCPHRYESTMLSEVYYDNQ